MAEAEMSEFHIQGEEKIRIIYPFPMHINQGFSYMLSISQFVNALGETCNIDFLTLDISEDAEVFFKENLGLKISKRIKFVQISNKFLSLKSNKVFFKKNVSNYIKKTAKKNEKIVIYSRDYKQLASLMKIFANRKNIKFVFEAHQIQSQNLCRRGKFSEAEKLFKIEKNVYENVDGIIAISPTLKQEIVRLFKGANCPYEILPVGVSENFFTNRPKNFSYDIIYSGNFSEWKGIDVLISAIAILKKDVIDLKVLFVGVRENNLREIQEQLNFYKLESVIDIRKRAPICEIPALISCSKVGVVSISYKDDGLLYTSPLKLFEYLASGMQVVVSSVPSLLSSLPHELVHWSIPEDSTSLSEALYKALKCDNAPNSRGISFARENTWHERGKKLLQFLQKKIDW